MKKILATLMAGAASTLAGQALALNLTVTPTSATWENPVGNPSFLGPVVDPDSGSGIDTTVLPFGQPNNAGGLNPGGLPSSYAFQGQVANVELGEGVEQSDAFLLGSFTHANFQITPGTSLQTTQLELVLGITGDAAVNGTFTFDFTHTETPNNDNPCAEGGVTPCPDKVSISNPRVQVNIGGQDYFVLLGFAEAGAEADGEVTLDEVVNSILTLENQANKVNLYAFFSTTFGDEIPWQTDLATAAGALMLGGMAYSRYRKIKP